MSNTVLVIGQSGSGKSTSLRNLDPSSTFLINVLDKPLPFKNFKKDYNALHDENKKCNYLAGSDWSIITKYIKSISERRSDIKTLVIDDWQYILAFEFIERATEKGYDKFSDMAKHGWSVVNECMKSRSDLNCFILSHSDIDQNGRSKCKTIGKMLDEKITMEGLFTTVLHSRVIDGEYLFQTQSDNDFLAKSPMGMFDDLLIPNDLISVKLAIENYYNEEN